MDNRTGIKPPKYKTTVNYLEKFKEEYKFYKRTQPIIEKVLKLREKTDTGTTADLSKINSDKLKELIKKCPELKEGISNVLLSELIKKGTVVKKDIDEIKSFIQEEKPFSQKTYTWLAPTDEPKITNELKYNVIPYSTFNMKYTYWG